MRGIARKGWLTLVLFLTLTGLCLSLAGQQDGSLVVAGHVGQAPVTQFNGHPYVAIDALARLMNGSLGYRGNEITLTLPGAASAAGAAASQPTSRALSRDFLNATIETMGDVREWRSALLVAAQNQYQAIAAWMDPYQAEAAKNLHLASVAAITDSDREALQLLSKEFGHMQQLHNKVLAARKNLSYITSDTLEKDPLDQKVLKCAHALGVMAVKGVYQDDGSCH
jgi:hypothetical protein